MVAESSSQPPRPRQGSWQRYDVLVEPDHPVPMRDGVRLATDVYRPALGGQLAPGRFPAILERTPYNKQHAGWAATARFFARHGYVAVYQDVRGRFSSEGAFYPFRHDAADGYDTVEWLAAQPWCDGRVGTIGLSYSASNQSALAALAPPHLAAQFVAEGMSSYYAASMRHGGALETRMLVYAFWMAVDSKEALADPALRQLLREASAAVEQWLARLPLKRGASPLRHLPSYEA